MNINEHWSQVATVYETSDYDAFHRLDENRIVTDARAAKLAASIGEKEILNPIIVNESMEIIDGQGRYEALKRLGKPIKFLIAAGTSVDDCRRMNRYNSKWTATEWVLSYMKNSDPVIRDNYTRLENMRKETGLSYSIILKLSGHTPYAKGPDGNRFEAGKISFSEEAAERVREIHSAGLDIMNALLVTKSTNQTFWTAVGIVTRTEGYDHERMLRNCAKQRSTYQQMASTKAQLIEFSRIYNYKAGSKKTFFEDYLRNKGAAVRNYDKLTDRRYTNRSDVSTLVAKTSSEHERMDLR